MNAEIRVMFINGMMAISQHADLIQVLHKEADKFQVLQDSIVEWSTATFGDRQTSAVPVIHHLEKEAAELIESIENSGNYREEFADCFMLLIEAAKTCGIETDELISITQAKLEKNKKRKWGKPNDLGVIEHIDEVN